MVESLIVNASCVEYLQNEVPEESVDLTVTSPPYNLGLDYGPGSNDNRGYEDHLSFTHSWLSEVLRVSRQDGRLCLNIPLDSNKGGKHSVYSDILQEALRVGWKYNTSIIWNEQNISRRTAWGSWISASAPFVTAPVEMIVVLYKNTWKKARSGVTNISKEDFMAWTNGVWTFSGEKKKSVGGHPAAFPVELPRRCIKLYSYVGDLVLDPFSGSGSTALAAKQSDRKYLGIELSPEFYKFSLHRLENCHDKNS